MSDARHDVVIIGGGPGGYAAALYGAGIGLDIGLVEMRRLGGTCLIEGCGNLVAGQMLRQLNNRVTVLRRISMSQPGRLPQTLAELDAIVAAIEQGDADQAARLSAEHVQKASQGVLRAMAEKAGPAS